MKKTYFVTAEEAGNIDRYTIEKIGIPQLVLMEKAAEGVVDAAEKLAAELYASTTPTGVWDDNRKDAKIVVLSECGNNGADGIAAARILKMRGYENVCPIDLGQVSKASAAFIKQVEIAENIGLKTLKVGRDIEICEVLERIQAADIVIDAIFGVGLKRPISGLHETVIHEVNQISEKHRKSVLSVDIPSGIDSTSGAGLGTFIKAGTTVTFGFQKTGMLFMDGREACGEIICHDICLAYEKEPIHFSYDEKQIKKAIPKRKGESNKGSFGKVLVAAGAKNMCGAALFSAEAAYKTGAGLVTVLTVEENREIIQRELPEAVLKTWTEEGILSGSEEETIKKAVQWADVIVAGPGLGTSLGAKKMLEVLLSAGSESKTKLLLDADALNIVSEDEELKSKVKAYAGEKIMTPHMGEAKRLFDAQGQEKISVTEIKKNRDMVAKRLAEEYDSNVILKDARSIVVSPKTDDIYINLYGNSGMAKGGSGDVLTGIAAALWGQKLDAYEAAITGCSLHAMAGDEAAKSCGEYSMLARDLIQAIPDAIKHLMTEEKEGNGLEV